MGTLRLHSLHEREGASFTSINGEEIVDHYGDWRREHHAIWNSVGLIDVSGRTRVCLTGEDRHRFLHGQVTNDIVALKPFHGCYAVLVTAKGKIQADLNVFNLEKEILLDTEPGLTQLISDRLNKYIIADDVTVIDVAPFYGHFKLLGPKSLAIAESLSLELPTQSMQLTKSNLPEVGDLYLANTSLGSIPSLNLFIPIDALQTIFEKLTSAIGKAAGLLVGWKALETARVESGIPRFHQDMDETNLPPEAGLDKVAVSYSKGCYIGQEIIARIRTYGQVSKSLKGLEFLEENAEPAKRGTKLYAAEKEVGYVTSCIDSPRFGKRIGLGYVRREANKPDTQLTSGDGTTRDVVKIHNLPFNFPLSGVF